MPYEELHQSHIRVHHEMMERLMQDLHTAQPHEQMRQQIERDHDLLQREMERLREAQAMAMLGLAQWQMQAAATGPFSSLQAFDEFHDAFSERGEEFHRQFRERAKIAREKSRVEYSTWQQRLIESRDAAILFPGSIAGGGPVEGRGRFAFGQGPPEEAWKEFRTWFRDESAAFRASFHHATRPSEFTYMKPSRRGGLRNLDYV